MGVTMEKFRTELEPMLIGHDMDGVFSWMNAYAVDPTDRGQLCACLAIGYSHVIRATVPPQVLAATPGVMFATVAVVNGQRAPRLSAQLLSTALNDDRNMFADLITVAVSQARSDDQANPDDLDAIDEAIIDLINAYRGELITGVQF